MRVLEKDDAAFWTHSHSITHPPQGPQPETSALMVDLRSRSHSPMMLESPSGTPSPVSPPSSVSAQPPSPPRTPEPAVRPMDGAKPSEEPASVSSIPLAQPGLPTVGVFTAPGVSLSDPCPLIWQSSAPATVQPFRRLFPLARPLPLSIPPHPLLATRAELKELTDAINIMKDKLADPGDAFEALRERVALLEKRHAELHARSDEASKAIDECKHTVDDHQEQIVDLEDRIAELDSTHHELRDMHQELRDMKDVDEDTPMSNASLHASLSEVREDIESLRRSFSERSVSMDASSSSDALETKMKSLRVELESEASNMLTNLRTEWEEQKAQYMLHLQRTQNEAMQDIVLTSQREAAALVSLKRKRSLELEELEVDGAHERPHPSRSTLVATLDGVEVPSPKRKRVLAAVAHTATVMTLGAVTAWSVLAFT
ncbi:hypothetical protein EYR40_002261 [Pleurotus pulmonarius]|nr:hypothetical protein EYR36_002247 [Pleurotus pulmonarius]KAF4583770.1 hypothetical protein EYR40_002261 [Pleurotus pulmonarius]